MRLRTLALLLAGAALFAPAQAQTIPKISFRKDTLPNGLEVIMHEDHSVPLVAVNVWYKVGSGDEQKGRTGFAHLFEHIMFMGSQNVATGQFDQQLEAAGGNNNGSTSQDRTNYYEWMPSNALPLALWLEADRMGFLLPTMDQSKLDLQRDVVQNERRQRVDNVPYGKAYESILALLYPTTHPYSWPTIGSLTDLQAASLDDVKNFFRTYYAPNNASLVIAGDFDPDSAMKVVRAYFADIPRGPALPARPAPTAITLARDTFAVLEDKVQLPRVYNVWHSARAFHADDATLDVLSYVLAGDKNSRLYKRLVYDLQVAQDVSAFQNSGKLAGSFFVQVTPKPGQTPQRMQQIIDEELQQLVQNGITPRELERAQNSFRSSFLDRLAGVTGKADQLNFYNYYVGNPDYVQEDAARYDRVSAADVQRVARQYLGQPRVVLTVVPEGKTATMVKGARGVTP